MLEHLVLVENTFAKLDVECLKSEFILKGGCHVDGGGEMNGKRMHDHKGKGHCVMIEREHVNDVVGTAWQLPPTTTI